MGALYSVTIDGVERVDDILANTIVIEDNLNDQQNICNFRLIDRSGNGIPASDQEIIITLDDATVLFAGYIVNIKYQSVGATEVTINCIDYARLLDRNLVHRTYEDATDKEIIEDIVSRYCAGFGITTVNVTEAVTISQKAFNYIQPTQALKQLTKLTNRNWYIDYNKDIHYFAINDESTPFDIDIANDDYINLNISKDASQLKNRVYVRGGTKLSDATTYSTKGDGVKRQFVLPDKPHDVTIKVNTVTKTIGIKNIDSSGYDWYLNFQEKYLEQDDGGSVLTSSDTLEITYKYDIPILVAVEDTASILENGSKEFAIFDKSIATTQAARDRATAELTDYADKLITGSFQTFIAGFHSGQTIHINLANYEIDDDYIVQKVTCTAFGNGNYIYTISIASAKTLGIIRFLIELLEANKNLIELSDQEVVDELLNLSDSLLSDSLIDSLTTDSAGAYATWCTDSVQSSPSTRARWGLFQWG